MRLEEKADFYPMRFASVVNITAGSMVRVRCYKLAPALTFRLFSLSERRALGSRQPAREQTNEHGTFLLAGQPKVRDQVKRSRASVLGRDTIPETPWKTLNPSSCRRLSRTRRPALSSFSRQASLRSSRHTAATSKGPPPNLMPPNRAPGPLPNQLRCRERVTHVCERVGARTPRRSLRQPELRSPQAASPWNSLLGPFARQGTPGRDAPARR